MLNRSHHQLAISILEKCLKEPSNFVFILSCVGSSFLFERIFKIFFGIYSVPTFIK